MPRKPLSKAVRFEVFKRDKFTCQYCGASAPDVILEVDHINPVSKGGTDDLFNLITSCRDCNRGKRNKKLSDNSAVKLQKAQLDDMQERRNQIEMMCAWRENLKDECEIEIDYLDNAFNEETNRNFTDHGRRQMKLWIHQFGFANVCEAMEISLVQYYNGTDESCRKTFDKIGGICYNRQKAREANA